MAGCMIFHMATDDGLATTGTRRFMGTGWSLQCMLDTQ